MKLSKVPAALAIMSLFLLMPSSGGSAETWVEMNSSVGNNLYALWGTSDWDIFAAGAGGRILRYTVNDTLSWTFMNSGTSSNLYGLWGSSRDNVYAAGGQLGGIILQNTGGPWGTAATIEVTILYGMWGSSPSNVYAVGELGSIYNFNGNDWASIESPTDFKLYSVWGSASDDIYIGGEFGTIYRYHGGTWAQVAGELTLPTVRALWGPSATDVFAACDNGVILHYDGTAWEVQNTGTGLNLYSIWGSSGDDVFAAGENGIILKYDSEAGTWSPLDTTGITIEDHLRAIWGSTAGNVYFAGDGGTIVRLQRDDTIPPKVISTGLLTLNDGKAYVTTQVVFHFSEEMDETSLNPETIILTRGSTAIPGTVAVSDDHRSATFTPSDSLAYSTIYAATVRGGAGAAAKDAATPDKNAMEANYTLSFTTEDSPSSGGSGGGGCFIMSARP